MDREGRETEAAFRERTGRGKALEVKIAVFGKLRKSSNRYHHLCSEVKELQPQEGTGLCSLESHQSPQPGNGQGLSERRSEWEDKKWRLWPD